MLLQDTQSLSVLIGTRRALLWPCGVDSKKPPPFVKRRENHLGHTCSSLVSPDPQNAQRSNTGAFERTSTLSASTTSHTDSERELLRQSYGSYAKAGPRRRKIRPVGHSQQIELLRHRVEVVCGDSLRMSTLTVNPAGGGGGQGANSGGSGSSLASDISTGSGSASDPPAAASTGGGGLASTGVNAAGLVASALLLAVSGWYILVMSKKRRQPGR